MARTNAQDIPIPLCPREDPARPLRLAVLISGGGTTLQHLIDRSPRHGDGTLHANVETVIASRADAAGLGRAARHGITREAVPRKDFADAAAHSAAVIDAMHRHGRTQVDPDPRNPQQHPGHPGDARPDLIVLAGYLSLLTLAGEAREAYRHRVVNVHPALLPAFGGAGMYGRRVHEAVLAHGCKLAGCTVHLADDAYDTGPIVAQAACPVHDNDTPESLAARVQALEKPTLVDAINALATGRLRLVDRCVLGAETAEARPSKPAIHEHEHGSIP